MEEYVKFSPLHKIFGYGPETTKFITASYLPEMVRVYGQKYDSTHNEYLQYLITIGPIGMAAYIGMLISGCWKMLNLPKVLISKETEGYLPAIAMALLCYAAQASVNIIVPITAPYVWILLAMGMAGIRKWSD